MKKRKLQVHFETEFEQSETEKLGGERSLNNFKPQANFRTFKHKPVLEPEDMTFEEKFEDRDEDIDEDSFSIDSPSEEEVDPLLIEKQEMSFTTDLKPENHVGPSQAKSLYSNSIMKKKKEKAIPKKDNIMERPKAQRKDKGKTRFTAYMLWAKEVRQKLTEKFPHMDFSAISKRLGELWSSVPNVEKYNWKRRAKRLASKPGAQLSLKKEAFWKISPPTTKKKFVSSIGKKKSSEFKRNARSLKLPSSTKTATLFDVSPAENSSVSSVSSLRDEDLVNEPVIGAGVYKVVGTQPVDAAAYLKLLGESLTIIGERLKEHEGQIAVSGSVSVLLDSLLCALGPLMCLTQQIPETKSIQPRIFTEMLDNIAYIMPGL